MSEFFSSFLTSFSGFFLNSDFPAFVFVGLVVAIVCGALFGLIRGK